MNSYETDEMILEAIEAITGGNLECGGECGNFACDGSHPENCDDPAVQMWCEGGNDEKVRAWLDVNYPSWRDEAPLPWGAGELDV